MESVPPGQEDEDMEIITTVGAIVTGLVTVVIGVFSLASILFDNFN
jgi:hypothetical protein